MNTYILSSLSTKTLLSILVSSAFYSGYSQAVSCNSGIICKNTDGYVSSAIADGAGSSLIFTSPDVTIGRSYGGNTGIIASNNANMVFEGNASIVSTDPNLEMSRATAALIENGAHVTIKDNFQAEIKSIDSSPGIVILNSGQLTIGKDLQIRLMSGSTSGSGLYLGGNSEVSVRGKAVIRNDSSSTSLMNFSVQGSSTAKFNQLDSISNNHFSTIVGDTANLITEGETLIENVSAYGDGLWFNGQSVISLGDTQTVADEMITKRAGIAQLNVGDHATIKTNGGDAIYILSGASDSVTTVRGTVISNGNAYVVAPSSSKNHELNIVNGTVIGNVKFNAGNDRFYISSGVLSGNVDMGKGNNYFEATGGKIKGSVYLGSGHNNALVANDIDTSELTSLTGSASNVASETTSGTLTLSNIHFDGYSLSGGTGTLLSNWDSISLKDQATMTITGDYLETKSALNIDSTSTLQAVETGNTIKLASASSTINNAGHIKITNNTVGERWHILGNYHGEYGLISINTVLNGDDSQTDKLSIDGDTSGTTYVKVNNVGGRGELTDKGIEIITVDGESNGVFKKMDNTRIVAGLYEYDLVQKEKNWYLTSELSPSSPIDPTPPPSDPNLPPTDPNITLPPVPAPEPEKEQVYRPESGSYMDNHLAANSLFITRLHDRLGETQYTDILTGKQKVTSMWMRNIGGHTRSRDGSGQLKTQSNRYVLQIGGDVAQWSTDGLDRWHLGLMTGYANHQSKTRSKISGYSSEGSVEGYHAGVYGTWYANDKDKNGSYLDTWAIYNWFDNEVKGQSLATEKYKSRGVTASVEAGYTFKMSERESDGVKYYLQPKAQVIWMNVRADDHTESNGTRVSSDGDGNIQTRLGLRAYMNGHSDIDKGKSREFEPFIEANWIHNTHNFGVTMNNLGNEIRGTKNIGELKVGVESQLSKPFNMWGNVGQQLGDNGYSDTQVMLGIKYSF